MGENPGKPNDPHVPDGNVTAILPIVTIGGAAALIVALVWHWEDPAVWLVAGAAIIVTFVGYRGVKAYGRMAERASMAGAELKAVLDSQTDAVLLSAGGKTLFANRTMLALLGFDPAEPEALPPLSTIQTWLEGAAVSPGDLLRALEEAAERGETPQRLVGASMAEGGAARHEISARSLGDVGLLWRIVELGDGPVREEDWRGRADRLASTTSSGMYSIDSSGRFIYVNPRMAQWLGRSQEDIVRSRLSIREVMAGDAEDDPLQPGISLLSFAGVDGATRDLQVTSVESSESGARVIHATARPVGPAGGTAQRFLKLFQEIPVGVALLDSRLRIGDCNAPFHELVDDRTAVGKPFLNYVMEKEKVAISGELQAILDGRSSPKSLEIRFSGGKEDEGVASIFAGRLLDDQERIAGLVLLAIDTTEQKHLEAQLAQSQKMQAVGQLAGGIAHDFNNVLTAMIGFCDLLLQRHRPGDQSFADIMQIKQNANRAAALVRQLLAFSRQQTLQPRLLNVTEVLAELSNLLRRLLGEKIELRMAHGRDLGLIRGDQGQLEQVIINLAVNARDAMGGGGRLTIQTANVVTERPRQAHGEVMPAGDYVQISISDTGMGIPKENFARIFEPFFTTKEVGSGTGLGLSTVYGIVKQTGGYLFVDSVGEGKGATFDIYFRKQQADTAAADSGAVGEVAADLTGGGTVLLVEDEDPVRLFSARALRNKGYKVIEAKTGEAALELLPGGEFDLLVTDMVMPRVDGSQVIREARKQLPDLPVICISGYTEESVLKEVESLDNLRFLSKPFSLKQLASAVKESIDANERRRTAAGNDRAL